MRNYISKKIIAATMAFGLISTQTALAEDAEQIFNSADVKIGTRLDKEDLGTYIKDSGMHPQFSMASVERTRIGPINRFEVILANQETNEWVLLRKAGKELMVKDMGSFFEDNLYVYKTVPVGFSQTEQDLCDALDKKMVEGHDIIFRGLNDKGVLTTYATPKRYGNSFPYDGWARFSYNISDGSCIQKFGNKFEIHTELGMPPPRDGYKMPPVVKGRTP